MNRDTALLQTLYQNFNQRDIDAVLAQAADDVAWANGLHGGHVHGHAQLRDYWTAQWAAINPKAQPQSFTEEPDGTVTATVHMTVHDLAGNLLLDETVLHNFRIENGKVQRFDIKSPSQLSSVPH